MGELVKKWIYETLIQEDAITKKIVIYSGRFQPFHRGHYETYNHLIDKFGKDNVFIATSDKHDGPKNPFDFSEKKRIMTTMFPIDADKVVQIKNPYVPTEILQKFDSNSTAYITVVGNKDKTRFSGKYFKPYTDEPTSGYVDSGYIYVAPPQKNEISGTDVRRSLSSDSEKVRLQMFKNAYPKMNKDIYNLITNRLIKTNEIMENFISSIDLKSIINETSQTLSLGKSVVDDGPGVFYGNMKTYKNKAEEVTKRLGYDIISYLMDEPMMQSITSTEYPNGPGRMQTSWFPTGISKDAQAHRWGEDLAGEPAYKEWHDHIQRVAGKLGFEFVKFLEPIDLKNTTPDIYDNPSTLKRESNNGSHKNVRFSKLITDIKDSKNPIDNRILLLCGGAWGHLNHPFDIELDLTFDDLVNIIDNALDGKLDFVREKCISGDSVISTENYGEMTIAEFVDGDINDRVLSYNDFDNINEFKSVIEKFNNDTTDSWLEIETEDGKTIQVTPNHRIYVIGKGYIQAKDLTPDMELRITD